MFCMFAHCILCNIYCKIYLCMVITEQLQLEENSGDFVVQSPCSKQGELKEVAQACVELGAEYLQRWGLYNLFVKIHMVLFWLILELLKVLLIAAQASGVPPTAFSFILSANLLRVCSVPSSSPLKQMLCRMSPSVDLCGSPLVISFQLDFVTLVTAFWAWHFFQFSIHLFVKGMLYPMRQVSKALLKLR